MSETLATHHKIKAEWTKASNNEILDNSSSESDKLEIIEDEKEIKKIEILEQIVIKKATAKSVKCHYCDKNVDASKLDEHQSHHLETFFHCTHENCDKKFRRKSSLRKHLYIHSGKFKYECVECNVKFIDLSKFELHKNTKHKTKDSARWKCQEENCGKLFASQDYLKRHQVTHRDEYKYKCTHCEQKFKWMTSLQMHMTIHTQNKPLVECSTCLKRFFNQRTLERHQKIHNNIKYKCMLCERVVSNRKDNIRRHIRHLHPEFNKSEIANKIVVIDSHEKVSSSDDDSDNADLGTDNDLDDSTSFEEPSKPPSPLPVINNRVNVIQSIGNPNKHQKKPETPQPPQMPQIIQEEKIEITLPPKKKAIVIEPEVVPGIINTPETAIPVESASDLPLESTSAPQKPIPAPLPKPKYDPIEQYRKILLGESDDQPQTIEDTHEEEEADQEVFPIHWRKRTSQNFISSVKNF